MKILAPLATLGLTLWPAVVLATSGPRENTLDPTQDPRALVCPEDPVKDYFKFHDPPVSVGFRAGNYLCPGPPPDSDEMPFKITFKRVAVSHQKVTYV